MFKDRDIYAHRWADVVYKQGLYTSFFISTALSRGYSVVLLESFFQAFLCILWKTWTNFTGQPSILISTTRMKRKTPITGYSRWMSKWVEIPSPFNWTFIILAFLYIRCCSLGINAQDAQQFPVCIDPWSLGICKRHESSSENSEGYHYVFCRGMKDLVGFPYTLTNTPRNQKSSLTKKM